MHSLTSALDGDECSEEKNSQPLPRLEPPIIQPVAQRYNTQLSRQFQYHSSFVWLFLSLFFIHSHSFFRSSFVTFFLPSVIPSLIPQQQINNTTYKAVGQ
jgi:hypothetical protein